MDRNLAQFTNSPYDLLIIGGGIYGATLAWEATLRGLSVALIEKLDFGSATSANSLKVIHGGLRYLQHADFKRTRESIAERQILMRIAPHLVHPLPVMMPTYGYGMKGRHAFWAGLTLYDLIGFDRNRGIDRQKHIPAGEIISKEDCLKIAPGLSQDGLNGGAIFYDAQVYNSERLIISFLKSAVEAGAHVANYVEASGFILQQNCVKGIHAKDNLTGDSLNINAKMIVNTSGPWINSVLRLLNGLKPEAPIRFAKAINLVTRPLFEKYAVGISGQREYQDKDAIISKGSRFFFIAPWRDKALVGTEYLVYEGDPNAMMVTEKEIQNFITEVNRAYAAAKLTMEDVSFVHAGLVPMTSYDSDSNSIQLTKHYQIQDHRRQGVEGLISVVGVKYTTARDIAQKVVNYIYKRDNKDAPPSTSAFKTLYGGKIEQFKAFLKSETANNSATLPEYVTSRLIYNYGSAYSNVLNYLDNQERNSLTTALLQAETRYAVREEMAQKLTDVIFRRTEIGSAEHPGETVVRLCAETMQVELGWSQTQTVQEITEVNERFIPGYYGNYKTRMGSSTVQQISPQAKKI
ncbi:MAG: glycerol-3-phosphate dehydrogenase/oxidase [Anaerolineales bacterium]|nr:glycerol-3-phosphate dehydrogenase/oxidase [Anaerolineales bacterium]